MGITLRIVAEHCVKQYIERYPGESPDWDSSWWEAWCYNQDYYEPFVRMCKECWNNLESRP